MFDRKRKHPSQKSLHKRVRLCDETSIISYLVFRKKNVEDFDIEGGESSQKAGHALYRLCCFTPPSFSYTGKGRTFISQKTNLTIVFSTWRIAAKEKCCVMEG